MKPYTVTARRCPSLKYLSIVACALGLLSCGSSAHSQTAASDPGALRTRAEAARAQGDIPHAIALYEQAVAADPQWLDGWWFLGNLQYGADQYDQARDSLTHFITLSPNARAAFALRGLCEFETGAFPESLQDIQQAIALGAANQSRNGQILLYHEALLLTRLGRFEEATAKYTLFVKQGITNQDVAVGFGLAGLRMQLLPRSVNPDDAPRVTATGNAAIKLLTGDIQPGRQAFQEVLGTFPGTPYVHYFCGYLLFATNPNEAIEEFKMELTVSPTSALAHSMLAWATEFRGDYSEALPYAQAAVKEDPSLAMSQLVLGRALVETQDLDGALAHLGQVVTTDPANLEAHLSLAKVYSKLGRKQDAQRERQLCLQLAGKATGSGTAADANR